MRLSWTVAIAITLGGFLAGVPAVNAGMDTVPRDPRARVEHHLHEVMQLSEHFESVLAGDCPHFGSEQQWNRYFDNEVERVVLLRAHLEQAWLEAKQTQDDDVRRTAKAPRKNLGRARALVDKLQQCATDNGASFSPLVVWQRIESEVPRRQQEVALPR